jgi:hypothetical protein
MQQLIQMVDSFKYGTGNMQQVLAPQNLLVDPDTHKILLFHCNWGCRREEPVAGFST